MAYVFALMLILYAGLVAYITRSLAHPATFALLIWFVVFSLVAVTSGQFYPLDSKQLALVFMMPMLISAGALLGAHLLRGVRHPFARVDYTLTLLAVLLLEVLGFRWFYVTQTAAAAGSPNILSGIRAAALEGAASGLGYNLVILSLITNIIAAYQFRQTPDHLSRGMYALAALLAFGFATLTGSKANVLNVIVANFAAYFILFPKNQIKAGLLLPFVAVPALGIGMYFINFSGTGATAGEVLDLIVDYFVGGTVAFASNEEAMRNLVNHQNLSNAFAGVLGEAQQQIHFQYVGISDFKSTNIYTAMLPMLKEYGYLGTPLVLLLIGAVLGIVYRWSRLSAPHLVLYAVLAASLTQTIANEPFIFGIPLYLKYIVMSGAIWLSATLWTHLPRRKIKIAPRVVWRRNC